MNKNFLIDYFVYILFKLISPLVGILPKRVSFWMGSQLGLCVYWLDAKHRSVAYTNVKEAFGVTHSPGQLSRIAKDSYRTFGQNFIEIFLIPFIDKGYLNRYIRIEGLEYVSAAFAKGKGVIFLGIHEGSWELSALISAHLGLPFNLFVQGQKYPRLNRLLNAYRIKKGCRIIEKKNQTKQLIEALRRNEALGMTVDQGGKTGTLVTFFKKDASMSSGALRLALKYDVALLPVFYRRIDGPYIEVKVNPPFEVEKTGDFQKDVQSNLQEIIAIFQTHITRYPCEYLWTYKIWKYSRTRKVLILDDGKVGHLRQSQSVAKILGTLYKEKAIQATIETVKVSFKNVFLRRMCTAGSLLGGKYSCQGCMWCVRKCLTQETFAQVRGIRPDIIVSCGSSTCALNFLLARENGAKSIAILRPSVLSVRRFDLVIMPTHDRPPAAKNVVSTEGALTLIDQEYLRRQSQELLSSESLSGPLSQCSIGVLLGGNTKDFVLEGGVVSQVLTQITTAAKTLGADILLTTSRRTPVEIETLIKNRLAQEQRCKVKIIANEKNAPFAVGGILGLSTVIVVSPESISMISEALHSLRYVVVFDSPLITQRHRLFLARCATKRYIYLVPPERIAQTIEFIFLKKPPVSTLNDTAAVTLALRNIL